MIFNNNYHEIIIPRTSNSLDLSNTHMQSCHKNVLNYRVWLDKLSLSRLYSSFGWDIMHFWFTLLLN